MPAAVSVRLVLACKRAKWLPHWATYTYFESKRLTGDVAYSPIVTPLGSPDQLQAGIGVTYSFDTYSLW